MFLLNRDNKEEVKAEIADLQYKMFLLNEQTDERLEKICIIYNTKCFY